MKDANYNQIYHVFNRGVEKRPIFKDDHDRENLLLMFQFYLEKPPTKLSNAKKLKRAQEIINNLPEKPIVSILSYCLMPNHFHLAIQELEENGMARFMMLSLNSYVHYFNNRHQRVGPLFQGPYKSVLIDNDTQLIHLSRYIHLNPLVAGLTQGLNDYQWSSFQAYLKDQKTRLCDPALIVDLIEKSGSNYNDFVNDYLSYARDLQLIKNLLIDEIN